MDQPPHYEGGEGNGLNRTEDNRDKWPQPSIAQQNVRKMYDLRGKIRTNPSTDSTEIKKILSKTITREAPEALLAKDLRNEENLLMHAAAMGRPGWFKCIADEIREQVGKHALVKGLRELDINGAHILSRAASSRGGKTCFQEVYNELREVLGMGGVMGQLEADDHMGRNIMMHAAMGNHVDVFTEVHGRYKAKMMKPGRWDSEDETTSQENPWQKRVKKKDRTRRTVLHHAAEAGCLKVLQKVIKIAKDENVYDEMTSGDGNDRTPLMLVLRNSWGEGRNDQDAKFDELWKNRGEEDWMKSRKINKVKIGDREHQIEAKTELFHAVRGGPSSLRLFLKHFREPNSAGEITEITVTEALDLKESVDSPGNRAELENLRQYRDGMLLAAAAKGGHVDVMKKVVSAINVGHFIYADGEANPSAATATICGEPIKNAINVIKNRGSSLFTLAVMSGRPGAAKFACDIICKNFDQPKEAWDLISGPPEASSPLTHAVLSENKEKTMFDEAYDCLKDAANEVQQEGGPTSLIKSHFVPEDLHGESSNGPMRQVSAESAQSGVPTEQGENIKVTPLAAAAFRGNWELFWEIYYTYVELVGAEWSRKEVLKQVPSVPPKTLQAERTKEMHEVTHMDRDLGIDSEKVSAVMWKNIAEAFQRATTGKRNEGQTETSPQTGQIEMSSQTGSSSEETATSSQGICEEFPSWQGKFMLYSKQAVETATKGRFFEDLRELVKEGFPLHDKFIPELLENIEDHEQDIIDIVTYAVGNASNPFVMGASVSKSVKTAEIECPMHGNGLKRLRLALDGFICKLLDELPHTVRGMGMTLLRPMIPEGRLPPPLQQRRDILANLVGFIVVEWMLEPGFLLQQDAKQISERYIQVNNGPAFVDPLRRAVDRGSQGLDFLSKPLTLDYLHVKFMCTLPHFAAKTVAQPTINEGFYEYGESGGYKFQDFWPSQSLLTESNAGGASGNPAADSTSSAKGTSNTAGQKLRSCQWDTWLLCFLQGCKPRTCKQAPSARGKTRQGLRFLRDKIIGTSDQNGQKLIWRKFPHITILPGLQFLLAGVIGKPETFYQVPAVLFMFELFSYLVMLGLFCWIVKLENRDYIPRKECVFYFFAAGLIWREILELLDGMPLRRHGQRRGEYRNTPGGKQMNRMVSACTRYIIYDTWNFLDVMSIIFVVLAFIFRVRSTHDSGASAAPSNDFFLAQFFLAASTPFFFARLLLLSQIDETLGPMIQILWRLVSHTARFAVFIIVVMTSFGLAFHSLFFSCEEDSALYMHFGTFQRALLAVFAAALGEFGTIIDDFDSIEDQCEYLAPELAYHASVCLLVVYLVVMSVVLLNLLIAVLSTAHQEVYAKQKQEFFLARARLILQNAQAVAHRRIPVPFNLIQAALGILLDLFREIIRFFKKSEDPETFTPFTSGQEWPIIEGCLQRFAFALTFGLASVALSTLLWAVSLPWIAWSLACWIFQRDSRKNEQTNIEENGKTSRRPSEDNGQQKTAGNDAETSPCKPPPKGHRGHLRTLLLVVGSGVISIPALMAAALLGVACSIGSMILWFRGMWGVLEWVRWEMTEKAGGCKDKMLTLPTPMPGQERTEHWQKAWYLAKARNYRIQDDKESVHFHVAPLLKSTTGLSMGDLISRVNGHDEKRCTCCDRNDSRDEDEQE